MKYIYYLLIALSVLACQAQNKNTKEYTFSISPAIDKTAPENTEVIALLKSFLETKNNSISENTHWLPSDFDKYIYPYHDIFEIEKSKHGDNYFKPALMELVDIEEGKKLLKLGFIGVHPNTRETVIRCIYNIVAVKVDGVWKLKNAIDYQTRDWTILKENSITYYLPKGKEANHKEIAQQAQDIDKICAFFNTQAIDITYYSCYNPKQMFQIKGFDYIPNMYFSNSGGRAGFGDIIYSGNNAEVYTHEIVHIYTAHQFPKMHALLNEGIATYIGGSGFYNYQWHRNKFKNYIASNYIDLSKHTQTYKRFDIDNETSVPYMIGALICERTLRMYGKEKLFELFNTQETLWDALLEIGITRENITQEITKELQNPTLSFLEK